MRDAHGRSIHYLRISVTDRCNLRCIYCMPAEGATFLPSLLTDAELLRLASAFAALGIDEIRLTGGEPLLRPGIASLVAQLRQLPGIRRVTLTTNGVLLPAHLPALLKAGLGGVNFSLDTLDRAQYARLCRSDAFPQAWAGLQAALAAPQLDVKLNCVLLGENDAQLPSLAELARDSRLAVRLIERMPIGLAQAAVPTTRAQALALLEAQFGPSIPVSGSTGAGPAAYVTFSGFQGKIGFIAAITQPFCTQCNRVRLTANGYLKTCLQYASGVDLRPFLQASDEALRVAIAAAIAQKPEGHHFSQAPQPGDELHNMHQIGG